MLPFVRHHIFTTTRYFQTAGAFPVQSCRHVLMWYMLLVLFRFLERYGLRRGSVVSDGACECVAVHW